MRDFDQNHLLPNLNLIEEVELPEEVEEVALLLAVGEREIDLTSEEKEVASGEGVEVRTEVAFHLDSF